MTNDELDDFLNRGLAAQKMVDDLSGSSPPGEPSTMKNEIPHPKYVHQTVLVRAVRIHIDPAAQSHEFAMLAKESIFKAQDMIYDAPQQMQTTLRRKLQKIRHDLEALDRYVRKAG